MRAWPGLAAIGAGLVHLGVAAGAPVPWLVPLVMIGAAEAVWGVLALARPAPPGPRVALAAASALVAALVVLLLLGTHTGHEAHAAHAALPLGALAGGGTLDLGAGLTLAIGLRRPRTAEPGPLRFLLTVAPASALVAVVAATSLAGTPVGAHHLH